MTWLTGVTLDKMQDAGEWTGGPPKGVLHTTECAGWPGYAGGTMAPHFTVAPVSSNRTISIRQHVSLKRAARALVNKPGGVQTNRDNAIQIELIGTCDPARRDLFSWPQAPDWALTELGLFMHRLEAAAGIRPVTVPTWKPYPASYGANGVRLSLSTWDNFNGWCGHQHVPENDHGDPGDIKAAVLVKVSELPPPVKPPVVDVMPHFPLRFGQFYGPQGRSPHTGFNGATDRQGIRTWQARMRVRGWHLDVDGLYGPQTELVARQFQAEKGLDVDGLTGSFTWAAAWRFSITK